MSPGVISLGTSLFFKQVWVHAITTMSTISVGDLIFMLSIAGVIATIALMSWVAAKKL